MSRNAKTFLSLLLVIMLIIGIFLIPVPDDIKKNLPVSQFMMSAADSEKD